MKAAVHFSSPYGRGNSISSHSLFSSLGGRELSGGTELSGAGELSGKLSLVCGELSFVHATNAKVNKIVTIANQIFLIFYTSISKKTASLALGNSNSNPASLHVIFTFFPIGYATRTLSVVVFIFAVTFFCPNA